MARFSIRAHHPDPLGVRSDLENGRISESPDPPFFRNFLAQTFFFGYGGGHPPISGCLPYGTFSQLGGGVLWAPLTKNLNMVSNSKKSGELPNFWVPYQNSASPRSGWTSRWSEQKSKNRFFTCKTRIDQKGHVLGPFLARFSIRVHDPDPLGVSSDLKNGQF